MVFSARELCPNCIDFIKVVEEKMIVRDEPVFWVEQVVLYCRACRHELASTTTLKLKNKPLIL